MPKLKHDPTTTFSFRGMLIVYYRNVISNEVYRFMSSFSLTIQCYNCLFQHCLRNRENCSKSRYVASLTSRYQGNPVYQRSTKTLIAPARTADDPGSMSQSPSRLRSQRYAVGWHENQNTITEIVTTRLNANTGIQITSLCALLLTNLVKKYPIDSFAKTFPAMNNACPTAS